MAFGFFNVEEPGLTYSKRLAFRTDPALLSVDPINPDAPIAGEWLQLNSSERLVRPVNGDVTTGGLLLFPLIVDKSRTDIQSNAVAGINTNDGPGAKLTVLAEKGAIVITSTYVPNNAGSALTYNVGDELVPGAYLDPDNDAVTRVALTKTGLTPTGSAAGDLQAVSPDTDVVARVIRAPYTLSGVGVGSGRTVMTIQIL